MPKTRNPNQLKYLHLGQSKRWLVRVGRREGHDANSEDNDGGACIEGAPGCALSRPPLPPPPSVSLQKEQPGYSGQSSWASR